jgi:hypothetical protein
MATRAQGLKPKFLKGFNAGMNACSTLRGLHSRGLEMPFGGVR